MFVIGALLIVAGGSDAQDRSVSEIEIFSSTGSTWTLLPSMQVPRQFPAINMIEK